MGRALATYITLWLQYMTEWFSHFWHCSAVLDQTASCAMWSTQMAIMLRCLMMTVAVAAYAAAVEPKSAPASSLSQKRDRIAGVSYWKLSDSWDAAFAPSRLSQESASFYLKRNADTVELNSRDDYWFHAAALLIYEWGKKCVHCHLTFGWAANEEHIIQSYFAERWILAIWREL